MSVDFSGTHDDQLFSRAQEAGERRLSFCNMIVMDGSSAAELEFPGEQESAPYCGCQVCDVREVLDAALPYLAEIGRRGLA